MMINYETEEDRDKNEKYEDTMNNGKKEKEKNDEDDDLEMLPDRRDAGEAKRVLTSANLASDPVCNVNTNPVTFTRTLAKFVRACLMLESGFDSDQTSWLMSHGTHHHCAKSVFFHLHENVKVVLILSLLLFLKYLCISEREVLI